MISRRQLLQLLAGWVATMSQRSLPWQGTVTGDAGPYSDQDWQELQRYMSARIPPNAGVLFGSDSGTIYRRGLEVEAQSPVAAAVNVRPGAALVHGNMYISDAVEALSVAANASGNPRIDTIVLRKNVGLQTVRLAVLQGTPGAVPAPPTLTQTAATWEISLADIEVANGFVSIANSVIAQTAEPADGADGQYLYGVLNNSAITLKTGDVVIWDTSANRAVTTTLLANDARVAGVWVGTTPSGGYGRVQTSGIGLVRVNAAVARGALLATTTVAGRAVSVSSPSGGIIGMALEAAAGAGLVAAMIAVGLTRHLASGRVMYEPGGGSIAISSTTFADINTANLSITLVTSGGNVELIMQCLYSVTMAGGEGRLDYAVDGVRQGSAYTKGLWNAYGTEANEVNPFHFYHMVTGLAPGSHTFRPQARAGAIGETFNLTANGIPIIFTAKEL